METSLHRCNGTTVELDWHNVQVIEFTPGRNHKEKTRGISKSSKLMVRPRQEETKGIRPRHQTESDQTEPIKTGINQTNL